MTQDRDKCPFCSNDGDIIYSNEHCYAIYDANPVSPGHALVITRRHVASFMDLTPGEHRDLLKGLEAVTSGVRETFSPDGFNYGVNDGPAAGQTIFHVHVHVIPRYQGDMDDPRGGVRHVIPERGHY